MSAPAGPASEDHAPRIWSVLRGASIVYLAFTVSELILGRGRQFTSPALPAAMAAALWFPMPEGWWFLRASLALCALRYGVRASPFAALAMIAALVALQRCRTFFFPEGRLFHWAFGALAVWLAVVLFGLPRVERSFYPSHARPPQYAGSAPLELILPPPMPEPPPRPEKPEPLKPRPDAAPHPSEPEPAPQGWRPPERLARKLALVHELAPQKILAGDENGRVMELSVRLDDLLKDDPKDASQIEGVADEILAIVRPVGRKAAEPAKP
ncbi:MAG: hypothetical protein HY077_07520 [Elusimicrobia bacterium]|nr:hypothetical protein [Elusimicrobiota bacterium]